MGIWKLLKGSAKVTWKASKWTAKTTLKAGDRALDALTFEKLRRDCVYFNYEKRCCTHPDNIDYEASIKESESWSGLPPAIIYKKHPFIIKRLSYSTVV